MSYEGKEFHCLSFLSLLPVFSVPSSSLRVSVVAFLFLFLYSYLRTVCAYLVTSTPPALFHLSTNSSKAAIGFLPVTMSAQYSL